MLFSLRVVLLLLGCQATVAFAASPNLASSFSAPSSRITGATQEEATARLNILLAGIKSMQASFEQTTKSKTIKVPSKIGQSLRSNQMGQRFKGIMQVKRPGSFKWEVQSPMKQLVISNSNIIWVYDHDLAQATRQRMDSQLANTPALLLSGNIDAIVKSFKVTQPNKAIDQFFLYPLDKEGMFESLTISFAGENPTSMILVDALGQETQINFTQVKLNAVLPNNQFKFTVPPGVDVIDQ